MSVKFRVQISAAALALFSSAIPALIPGPATAGSAEGIGGANAPGARVAVYYSLDGPGVDRSKGVEKVTNPALGSYCVKIKSGQISDARKTIPVVSIDSETSKGGGASLFAAVATAKANCKGARRWISVKTFNSGGSPTDDAAWYLIVP